MNRCGVVGRRAGALPRCGRPAGAAGYCPSHKGPVFTPGPHKRPLLTPWPTRCLVHSFACLLPCSLTIHCLSLAFRCLSCHWPSTALFTDRSLRVSTALSLILPRPLLDLCTVLQNAALRTPRWWAGLAIGETVLLCCTPPHPLVGVSIGMESGGVSK